MKRNHFITGVFTIDRNLIYFLFSINGKERTRDDLREKRCDLCAAFTREKLNVIDRLTFGRTMIAF